jgi:hypothetical protein
LYVVCGLQGGEQACVFSDIIGSLAEKDSFALYQFALFIGENVGCSRRTRIASASAVGVYQDMFMQRCYLR